MPTRHNTFRFIAIVITLSAFALTGFAEETKLQIRAVACGAKIIGTHVGGALITVREVASGRVLAQGMETGGTGDTNLIMVEPRKRGATVYDTEGAAGFLAVIDIKQPTLVEIEATGPMGYPHAMNRTTKRLTVLPGQDVLGEGIVLEINGLVVELLDPPNTTAVIRGQTLRLKARMRMMCGCPISPKGLWDYNTMSLTADVIRDGAVVATIPFSYSGEPSLFAAEIPVDFEGPFMIRLTGADPANGNFGTTEKEFIAIVAPQ